MRLEAVVGFVWIAPSGRMRAGVRELLRRRLRKVRSEMAIEFCGQRFLASVHVWWPCTFTCERLKNHRGHHGATIDPKTAVGFSEKPGIRGYYVTSDDCECAPFDDLSKRSKAVIGA